MIVISTLFLILGNGFTIDLIKYLDNKKDSGVDVINLFKYGADIKWPANNKSGFLSYQNCPHLWSLGVRPDIDSDKGISIIEDVVTCANAIENAILNKPASRKIPYTAIPDRVGDIYKYAYLELSYYLRYLFIHYHDILKIDMGIISNWKWAKYFVEVTKNGKYDNIIFVTYNYDIWLEQVLGCFGIGYQIAEIEKNNPSKVIILKPHGSISFYDKRKIAAGMNNLKNRFDSPSIANIGIRYTDLEKPSLTNIIIPPAGESGKLSKGWAKTLRDRAVELARNLKADDDVVLCELSYWQVDRTEIDEILTSFDPKVNVRMFNPQIPQRLNAVLTSLFDNYVCFTNTDTLEG